MNKTVFITGATSGFGKAAELAHSQIERRTQNYLEVRKSALESLRLVEATINGHAIKALPNILNVTIANLDSEAIMLILKSTVAISNGSACTSNQYETSHVLKAMKKTDMNITGAIRFSWGHTNAKSLRWDEIIQQLSLILN